MKLVTVTTVTLLAASICYAQPTPKPTPAVTSGWCVNNTTGATRIALDKNGIVQSCHKNEQSVTLLTLESAPSPAPTAGTPDPTPSSNPSASATPAADAATVIDANGKVVGTLDQDGGDAQENSIVVIDINGVPLGLQVSQDGFVDEQASGVQLALWYPTTDCSGQGYIIVGGDGNGLDIQPLVEVSSVQRGPYIFGSQLLYAQPPWSNITMKSFQSFTDPTQPSVSGCETASPAPDLGTWLAGPPASFNLATLGFVPPFSVQE